MALICIPIIGPTRYEVEEQITQGISEADLFEFRLDLFQDYDKEILKKIKSRLPIPLIFTLRKKSQGGFYEGSEEKRMQEILKLCALAPEYFDFEFDLPLPFINTIAKYFPKIQRIISYHNFSQTPSDLEGIYQSMQHLRGHVYKLACHAHSTNDSLRMLQLVRQHKQTLGICMGEKGSITRILGPMLGAPWTFACLKDTKTAEGQLTTHELTSTYHIHKLTPNSALYGLMGGNVTKSISHMFHNRALQQSGVDAIYVKMSVEKSELTDFFPLIENLGFQGLSVTMPLKEDVIPFMTQIDEKAKKIGAVNTIVIKNSLMKGYNTDADGALDAIEKQKPVLGMNVIIIGAGGAARAIAFEAKARGAHVFILNRTKEKALKIATEFGVSGEALEKIPVEYDILVNTAPPSLSIRPEMICPKSLVMDINIIPKHSSLLQNAQDKRCALVFGYEMFINQAVGQYRIWRPNDQELENQILSQYSFFK